MFRVHDNAMFRNEWVKKKLLEIPEGFSICDAGCGTQKYKTYCKHLKYYSLLFSIANFEFIINMC